MIDLLAGPWGPAIIFCLRVVDVSMATVRVIMLVRGPRVLAPIIGFFEVLIWIVAVGSAIRNLTSPLHVLGYAGGYATGTAVGMWVEGKLALGWGVVRVFARGSEDRIAGTLRDRGFAVTEMRGRGRSGEVGVLYAVMRRREIPHVLAAIETEDPSSFVTVQSDAVVQGGWHSTQRRH